MEVCEEDRIEARQEEKEYATSWLVQGRPVFFLLLPLLLILFNPFRVAISPGTSRSTGCTSLTRDYSLFSPFRALNNTLVI